jgi:hypothetical protein
MEPYGVPIVAGSGRTERCDNIWRNGFHESGAGCIMPHSLALWADTHESAAMGG